MCKVWTTTVFTGYYPVSRAALVTADTPERAAELLNTVLVKLLLPGDAKPENMERVETSVEGVQILADVDY